MVDRLLVTRENEFSYPIVFQPDFHRLSEEITNIGFDGRQVMIITDSNVDPLYRDSVVTELFGISEKVSVFCFEAGEENKHIDTVVKILCALVEQGMDRKGYLAALGGGVVGDITGFAAAIYLRGIDFIQIPTTLLSQVDSSVGGKTGVDLHAYKNMVGAFHQPSLVYMNLNTLKSLPEVEFACGMGEVLKTGLICDGDFFRSIVADYEKIHNFNYDLLAGMVRRCCEIKAGVVERDPKEKGERALLNLGHTVGHAVEKLKNFELHHGQCVGLGLAAAAVISKQRGLLSEDEISEIRAALSRTGLPLVVSGLDAQDVLHATKKDKKMEKGQVKFILMNGIGNSLIDHTVSDEELLLGIKEILV